MAVIPGLPGLEATIEVNDKPLKEYDDPHARQPDEDLELLATSTKETEHVALNAKDIPHVVKYLEVESGTEFSCHFIKHASFHGRCDHLALTFERDLSKSYLSHEPSNDGREWNRVLKYINFRGSNGHARRSMLFEPLNIGKCGSHFPCSVTNLRPVSAEHSTLDTLNHDVFRARKLGTLRLLVYEMKHAEANKKDPRTPCRTSTSLHNHVMEKALKGRALDCAVSYGPAEPSDRIVEPENIFEDPLKRPCAVFEFRYRSRGENRRMTPYFTKSDFH